MVALGVAFLFAAAGPIGISVLVGVAARDVLDLSGTATGIVLFGGAMSALVLGPTWGRLLDSVGTRKLGLIAAATATVLAGVPSFATSGWALGIMWIIASAAISAIIVVFQALGASIMPTNRGGALSFLLSFRFVGHAIGPILFVPLIDWSVQGRVLYGCRLGTGHHRGHRYVPRTRLTPPQNGNDMRLRRDELDDPGGKALEPHCADSALGGAVVVDKDKSGLRRDPEFSPHRDVRVRDVFEAVDFS